MKKSEEQYFKMDALGYCGVMMDKDIMKKVVALQQEYSSKLRELLHKHEDRLVAYDWTMSYLGKYKTRKAVYAKYISSYQKVKDRIKLFKISPPETVENFLETTDRKEAERWCNREARKLVKQEDKTC